MRTPKRKIAIPLTRVVRNEVRRIKRQYVRGRLGPDAGGADGKTTARAAAEQQGN